MSLILRNAAVRATRAVPARQAQQARFFHPENVVGHTLPTSVANKPWLAFKIFAFSATGFGLPFLGAWWHIQKSAGGA